MFKGLDLLKTGVDVQWAPAIIGMVCAAIAGYIAIKFMLSLIQRKRLYGFAVYAALLGVFVLLNQFGVINLM